jgi:predicted nucleic acid-binding protein
VKYLVDANILSEPIRANPSTAVLEWIQSHELDLVVNPIILGELEYGILQLPHSRKKKQLEAWFASGIRLLNVAEMTATTAGEWARLLSELRRKGRAMPVKDSLIAATAREHRLTIATRNLPDFQHCNVPLVNPFGT